MLVDKCLLVEVKAVEVVHPIHKAQLLSYMKLLDIPLGLVINFKVLKLTDGVPEIDPTRSQSGVSERRKQRHSSPFSQFPPVQNDS